MDSLSNPIVLQDVSSLHGVEFIEQLVFKFTKLDTESSLQTSETSRFYTNNLIHLGLPAAVISQRTFCRYQGARS